MIGYAQKRQHDKMKRNNYEGRAQKDMCGFFEFLRRQGADRPEQLMDFVESFLAEPSKFSKDDLKKFEKRLDFALSTFSNNE